MGAVVAALTALLATWVVAPGDARAERIVLKSGEVVEGSIIDATRNTVIVQRSIGGMRQMPIQDIGEVQFDLAQGQQIAGQFLGWADGVYEIGSGDEVVRVSEGGVVGREPRQQTARLLSTRPSSRQQGTAAAAPAPARAEPSSEPMAAPASAGQNRNRAAADAESDGAAAGAQRAAADAPERRASDSGAQAAADQASDTEEQVGAAGSKESGTEAQPMAGTQTRVAAAAENQGCRSPGQAAAGPGSKESGTQAQPMAGTQTRVAAAENQAAADRQSQAAVGPGSKESGTQAQPMAGTQTRVAARRRTRLLPIARAKPGPIARARLRSARNTRLWGNRGRLPSRHRSTPPEPGARSMVFNIELSRPAEQTLVLIYGTVDGTAKAGEDYEAKQGMVTLAPGATTAEVRVPLIAGAPEDGEKRFELVLMADPKVADVVDRRVVATIKGAD